jgi:GNAT superfamily N-acetyltransferase
MGLTLTKSRREPLALPGCYRLEITRGPLRFDRTLVDAWVELLTAGGFRPTHNTFIDEFIRRRTIGVLLIWDGNRLVGTGGVRHIAGGCDNACLLTFVCVHPCARGQHLGRAITAGCIEMAEDARKTRMLLCTEDFRIAAIKCYLSLGFRPTFATWDRTHRVRWRRLCRRVGVPFREDTGEDDKRCFEHIHDYER